MKAQSKVMTDRFDGIQTFLQVVESGSLTLAAERLNLTRSAVGKALARLEARLGVRLLQRTTRSQSLTEEGQAYYEHCLRARSELETAESGLESGRREPRGRLRASVPLAFGHHHAAPALLGLIDRYPRLQVDVSISDRTVDLLQDGYDLAVRIGELPDSDRLVARRLGEQTIVLAAAPAYLARFGRPASVAALAQHRGIDYCGPGRSQAWALRDPQGHLQTVQLPWRARLDDLQAVADAAIAGAGVAWLPNWLLARYVQSGQLERVLADHRAAPMPIHVLWPRSHHMPAKTRCAVDALIAAMPACMEECRGCPSPATPGQAGES
jgi:DNA-binding transcriptional LysR family regulator